MCITLNRIQLGLAVALVANLGACSSPAEQPPTDATEPPAGQTESAVHACGYLGSGESINAGDSVWSCNGQYVLIYQWDGNLVLYHSGIGPIWASNTGNRSGERPLQAKMERTGNFAVYKGWFAANGSLSYAQVFWQSNTWVPGSWLAIQGDGNLVVYGPGGNPRWASNTAGRSRRIADDRARGRFVDEASAGATTCTRRARSRSRGPDFCNERTNQVEASTWVPT